MRSMRKTLLFFLITLSVIAMVLTMSSCWWQKDNPDKKDDPIEEQPTHEHSYVEETVAPTCTESGYVLHTCECGDSYKDNKTPAAHKMSAVKQKDPTCTEAGETGYNICTVCGYIIGERTAIPPIDHDYEVTYQYPTATQDGVKTSVCKHCGDTKTEVLEATVVAIPEASDILAALIGSFSASLEAKEDSELIYVYEWKDGETVEGTKNVLFIEVAEAALVGDGENVQAHLKLKVGRAYAQFVDAPSKDVVVDKETAEYAEVDFYVNGEDVSVAVNGETLEVTLTEACLGVVAEMLGIDITDPEVVAEITETLAMMQEMAELAPLVEKLMSAAADGMPTVSPEYREGLASLFALLGEDIVVTTTDASGNTTYTVNLQALKSLLEDIEGKTLAEYLEDVYGESVVNMLADFLRDLPTKTVRQIVDMAIDFAEGAGVEIADVYKLIDLYIYLNTGVEFDIEEQIATRYHMTVAELLIEAAGVPAEEQESFTEQMTASFAMVADRMETVTIDELLSGVLMGTTEGAIEYLKMMVDALDEAVVFEVTVNAEGAVTNLNWSIQELRFDLTVDGETAALNVYMADGTTVIITKNGESYHFELMQGGERVSSGDVSVSETVEGEDTVKTVVIDLRDDENDLLDFTVVLVNGEVDQAQINIRGYDYNYTFVEDPEGEYAEWRPVYDEDGNPVVDEYGDVIYDLVWGYDVWERELVSMLQITYGDYSADEKVLTITAETGALTIVIGEGEDTTVTVVLDVTNSDEDDYLDFKVVFENGTLTVVDIVARDYWTRYEFVEDPEGDDWDWVLQYDEYGNPLYDEYGDMVYDIVSGTWVPHSGCDIVLEIAYDDFGDGDKFFEIIIREDVTFTLEWTDGQITLVGSDDDGDHVKIDTSWTDTGLSLEIIDPTDGLDTTMGLLEVELNEDKDALTKLVFIINEYFWDYDEVTDERIRYLDTVFGVEYTYDEETDSISISIENRGGAFSADCEKVVEGEDTTVTVVLDVTNSDEDDYLDFKVVFENGTLTVVDIVARDYWTRYEFVEDPEGDDWDWVLQYDEYGNPLYDEYGDMVYDIVSGTWVPHSGCDIVLEIAYDDFGDGDKFFEIIIREDVTFTLEWTDGQITLVGSDDDGDHVKIDTSWTDTGLSLEIIDPTDGLDTTMGLLEVELNEDKDALTKLVFIINEYFWDYDEVTDERIRYLDTVFGVEYTYDEATGSVSVSFENRDGEFAVDYEETGDVSVRFESEDVVIAVSRDTEENGEETTVTLEADVIYLENDLLDFKLVFVNDELTAADILFVECYTYEIFVEDPEGEYIGLKPTYDEDGNIIYNTYEYCSEYCTGFDHFFHYYYSDPVYEWVRGYYETVVEVTEKYQVQYNDSILTITDLEDDNYFVIELGEKKVSLVVGDEDGDNAEFVAALTEDSFEFKAVDLEKDNVMWLLVASLNEDKTALKSLAVMLNGYYHDYNPETDEYTQTLQQIFSGSIDFTDNATGADSVVIECQGVVLNVGYEVTDENVLFTLADQDGVVAIALEAFARENTVGIDAALKVQGRDMLDGRVTLTSDETESADLYTLAIDLDHLQLSDGYWYSSYMMIDTELVLTIA